MKKIVFLSIFILIVCCSYSSLYAQQKPDTFNVYLSGKLGYSATFLTIKDTTNSTNHSSTFSSFNIGTAFGGQYYFMNPFGLRIEFEYLFRTKDKMQWNGVAPSTLNIMTHTILTNIYLDWHIIPQVAVYTQAGIGVAINTLEYETTTKGSSNSYCDFVWQAGIGTWYSIKHDTIVDFNIRYVGYSTKTIQSVTMREFGGLDILISFRYLF